MDLKNFKKISSDAKSTTLKHPEGHKIIIAHHALSPKMKAELKKIPNTYSDGTEQGPVGSPEDEKAQSAKKLSMSPSEMNAIENFRVPASQQSAQSELPSDQNPQSIFEKGGNYIGSAIGSGADYLKNGVAADVGLAKKYLYDPVRDLGAGFERGIMGNTAPTQAPQAQPQATESNAPAPASLGEPTLAPQVNPAMQDPYGTEAYQKNLMHGISEQKAGIQQEAAALGQQGKAEEIAAQQQIEDANLLQKHYDQQFAQLQQENQNVIKDIQNQHINPSQYQENMSSGQKVMTAIGLILGGMGGGLLHQENPALKFLNQQIDRDIEAQRAELGKKDNLLSANFKQFGNLRDAVEMTRANNLGIYSAKLKQAAAQATDPAAKARALQEAGKLDMQAAPILAQLAMKRGAMSGMQEAGADPARKIRMMTMSGIMSESTAKDAYKELTEAQGMVRAKDNILSAFNQVAKLNTLGNRTMNPMQSASQIDSAWDPMVAKLSKDTAGRFTDADAAMLNTLKPLMRDNEKTIQMKLRRINNLISEKMNFPMLKDYGLDPTNSGRFDPTGQNKIQMGAPVKR